MLMEWDKVQYSWSEESSTNYAVKSQWHVVQGCVLNTEGEDKYGSERYIQICVV